MFGLDEGFEDIWLDGSERHGQVGEVEAADTGVGEYTPNTRSLSEKSAPLALLVGLTWGSLISEGIFGTLNYL